MKKWASSIASAFFVICGIFSVYFLLGFLYALKQGYFFAVLFLLFGVISGAISLIGLFIAKAFNRMSPEEVKAFEGYRTLAEKGDREAQFSLGLRYDNGEGVAKDEVEAVKWYRKAADQGHAKAQFSLGYCYFNGRGVAKDEVEAVKWYRKAADQEDAKAQLNLGYCYFNGRGAAKDEVEAVKWYRKAADQGHAKAQFNLGTCYRNGHGVAKDEVEAYAFYNLAGITNENARKNLAILEKGMSPDARLRGQQRSKELQKEIETKIAAKQAEDVKKAGK